METQVKDNKAYLNDMLRYARDVQEFTGGMNYSDFAARILVVKAVERCLSIIGEAASRVSPDFKAQRKEIPWDLINGMRNILTRATEGIKEDKLWRTCERDIPALISTLEKLV